MSVKVEKKENSKVELEFTMSKEDFNKALDKAFVKNQKYFKVPGFRNGKVPRNIVEKVYGESVLYETVIEDNVDQEYQKAVLENNLEVVSKPEMDVKQIGKDKDFIYTVTVFVKPEIKLKKYKGLEIKKTVLKVTKKDVDARIEEIREKNAEIKSIDNRELKNNDISVIDFEGFTDGVAFDGGKAENFELTIGSGQFIPGFEDQLVGMKIGEEREINVKFPDEYHSEALAGKDAMFKVKLNGIKEKILPKLDDEFAKDVSEFQTLEEYKKDVEENLKKENESKIAAEKETKTIDALVENVEVDLPDAMIESELDQMIEQFSANLSYQGMDLDTYCSYVGTTKEEFRNNMKPTATRDVKFKLALEYISKEEKVEVSADEINAKIEELSNTYGKENAEDLKKNPNVIMYMKEKLTQEKTLDIVLNNVIEK